MKKIFIVFFLGFFALNTQAQFSAGATVGPQIPLGAMADAMKIGFGFNIAGKYLLMDHLALGLNIGYVSFGKKSIENVSSYSTSGSTLPITALVEYQIGKGKVKPYVGVDLGLYRFSTTINVVDKGLNSTLPISFSKMYFGFAPTAGALFELNDKFSLCANLKFNFIAATGGSRTYLGINIGAFYKIK